MRAARRAGTVVQVGTLANTEISRQPGTDAEQGTEACWARSASPREIDDAIAMLAASDRLDAVISHVIPAADAVDAFTVARDASASAKVYSTP